MCALALLIREPRESQAPGGSDFVWIGLAVSAQVFLSPGLERRRLFAYHCRRFRA
jgi:hypothetical protein